MPLQSRHTHELWGPSLSLSTDPIRLRAKSFVSLSPPPPRLLLCLRRRGGNFFFKRQERSRKRKEEMEPGSVEQKKIRIRKSEMKSVKEGARV